MDLWVNIKFMKSVVESGAAAARPAVSLIPEDARVFTLPCPVNTVNNARESIVALCIPRRYNLELTFDMHLPVRRVLVSNEDMPFKIAGDRLSIFLPGQEKDAVHTAELHGFITRPGLQIRIELPDPLRGTGDYAGPAFPERDVRRTLAMQFALHKAALILGIDRTYAQSPLGPVSIMGFDTNNPHGHSDCPPHVHIHPFGTRYLAPITHYYYGSDGRLEQNKIGLRSVKGHKRILGRGEVFEHVDLHGNRTYATRITENGGLELISASGQHKAVVLPEGGDCSDVLLECDGRTERFRAGMSMDDGILTVDTDGTRQYFRFDIDTGKYLGTVDQP